VEPGRARGNSVEPAGGDAVRWSYLAMIIGNFVTGLGVCPEAKCQAQAGSGNAAEWIRRGKADLDRSFFTEAESAFRKAITLQPNSGPAHLLLARALLGELPPNLTMFPDSQGVLPKAEQAANTAVELSPGNAEALCVAGIVSYKTALTLKDPQQKDQRMSQAKKTVEGALAADPRSVEAHTDWRAFWWMLPLRP